MRVPKGPTFWPSLAALVAPIAFTIAFSTACREPAPPGKHVVVVLLDAARPDRFGAYNPELETSPNIDRLAASGAVFLNHFSQASDTRSALPRFLYSRYFTPPLFPHSTNVPFSHPSDLFRRRDNQAISLPAVLSAHGYHSVMLSAHTWLKPDTPFAREFDEAHDLSTELDPTPGFPHPRAEAVIDYALDWLEEHRERDVFLYLHLMDTHSPRFFDANAAAVFRGQDAERWRGRRDLDLVSDGTLTADEKEALDATYDGSVLYTDRHLGRLFDLYREWGVLDETLIAITADHGEILGEPSDFIGHGGPWTDLVARTPLIGSYPAGLEAGRLTYPSELVDVAPTVVELLGLELPRERSFDGLNLFSSAAADRELTLGETAIRVEGHKAIFDLPDADLLAEVPPADLTGQLFDLVTDPGETTDLWDQRPEIVANALDRYRQEQTERYRRYQAAHTDRVPQSSFAVAARHFETPAPVPSVTEGLRNPWVRLDHWRDSYLQSRPGAPPLEVSFDIPSGVYRLSAAISGDATLELDDGTTLSLEGGHRTNVDVGEITVSDHTFRATLVPTGSRSLFSIHYFGFTPEGVASEDAERDERLRSLGYIN